VSSIAQQQGNRSVASGKQTAARLAPRTRAFWLGLTAIASGGLALRLWYGFTVPGALDGDSNYYHLQANLFADGRWFIEPFRALFDGQSVTSARHPPLWSLVLSTGSALGFRSIDAHRVVGCLIGTATVVVIGLVGRRLLGSAGGLIAAGLAAVYVNLWISDPLVEVTSLYILLIALFLLVSYRWIGLPRTRYALALGAIVGFAALTRGEGLALFVVAVPLTILLQPHAEFRYRLMQLAVTGLAAGLVVVPWSIYNFSRFEAFVPITTDGDFTLDNTNCDRTYSGRLVGDWSVDCTAPFRAGEDESQYAQRARSHAFEYIRRHAGEVPRVAAIRVLRAWDLFRPGQNLEFASIRNRDLDVSRVGQIFYWAALPFAAAGIIVLRRAGRRVAPLIAMFLLVTLAAAGSLGEIRYRGPAEVSIILLAAAALARLTGPLPRELSLASVTPSEGECSR
jgi:hypothetical protein